MDDSAQVDAYLRRLGIEHAGAPTARTSTPCANCICASADRAVREPVGPPRRGDRAGGEAAAGQGGGGAAGRVLLRTERRLRGVAGRARLRRHPARGAGVRGRGTARDPVRPSRAAGADGGRRATGWRTSGSGRTATARWRSGSGASRRTRRTFRIVEAGRTRPGCAAGRPGRRGPGRLRGRQAGVPAGGTAPCARRLRGRGLVAQHLAACRTSRGRWCVHG